MKQSSLPWLVGLLLLSGCSGFVPGLGRGPVVSPGELSQYSGGGSLSTLWYFGSDQTFHYFEHHVKVGTPYRVRRDELKIPDEFPYKSKPGVFVGDRAIVEGTMMPSQLMELTGRAERSS